jgi:hypothetical protein
MLGLALRHMNHRRPVIRYLADSSYWLYLMHLPVVLWLQIWLTGLAWSSWLKLLLVNCLTTAVRLLSYQVLVPYTFLGATLNGPRERRTQRRFIAQAPTSAEASPRRS